MVFFFFSFIAFFLVAFVALDWSRFIRAVVEDSCVSFLSYILLLVLLAIVVLSTMSVCLFCRSLYYCFFFSSSVFHFYFFQPFAEQSSGAEGEKEKKRRASNDLILSVEGTGVGWAGGYQAFFLQFLFS